MASERELMFSNTKDTVTQNATIKEMAEIVDNLGLQISHPVFNGFNERWIMLLILNCRI